MPFGIFRRPLVVHREAEGSWQDGVWGPGESIEINIRASVQPSRQEDMEMLPEGRRSTEALRLYTDAELRTIDPDGQTQPDRVDIGGIMHEVTARAPWQNNIINHNRYVVTRLDEQPENDNGD